MQRYYQGKCYFGGGSVKGGVVEIQGEKREQVAGLLRDRGYTVKVAGG